MEVYPRSLPMSVINSNGATEPITRKSFACKHSLFLLRFVGLWAEDGQFESNKHSKLTGYFVALIIVGTFGFQFSLINRDTNGEVIAKFIAEFLAAITALFKILPMTWTSKSTLEIWQKTYRIRSIPKRTLIEEKITDDWDSFQCKIIKVLIRCYIALLILYQASCWLHGDKFILNDAFPDWAKASPWYYLVYVVTTAVFWLRFVFVLAYDICSVIVMCRLYSEIQLVQQLIGELEENNYEAFRYAMMRHAVVLEYGRTICENYSTVFMFQHFDIAMSISFLGAVAIYTSDFTLQMKLTLFMAFYISQMAIICYAGEKLLQESLKTASSIENSVDKFLNDIPSLRLLSMMLLRSQKPLQFSFGSTRLSLSCYSRTLNTIYSFFMILKTMIE
ncbi:odorant receptor 4-like [Phymastichus coffea]|uniref:odorant receptor 4-like n=1 Tax=Phymastichus coffea TaxID=108790 RepID=UPI00273ADFEC|nr:odorant receptor 4-like [Phymastichus coffea]